MSGPRMDGATVDVLGLLLQAWEDDADLHGWLIMRALRRSGPSVYRALDRLEDAGWVTASWETLAAGDKRPRLRFYRLTADKVDAARSRLARRTGAFRPPYGLGLPGTAQ
jgi:PadR family transcriptional regulator